ncbi:MAG: BppU family phage baseplate upper protein [Bacteroidota bacterium]|nr:BppU family phage baseplate upper protein [Bacteroidota bacterium]
MENRYKIIMDLKNRIISNTRFKQGDTDSSVIEISLINNGVAVDITDQTIEFNFLKPDNTIVVQDSTTGVNILNAAQGNFECVLKNNTLAAAGVVKCEVVFKKDGKILSTTTFNFTVEGSIGNGDGILSSNYISAIENKIVEWQADIDAVKKAYDDSTKANTSTEVTAARHDNINNKDYANLGARLDAHDSSLNDIVKQTGISAPTTGAWGIGDKVWNTTPVAGGNLGWICVQTGIFGTATEPIFKEFGIISA